MLIIPLLRYFSEVKITHVFREAIKILHWSLGTVPNLVEIVLRGEKSWEAL